MAMQGVAKLTYEIIISFLCVFYLASFWMLVVPHDLRTFFHIFMSNDTQFFSLARFWMLELELEFLYFIPVGKLSFNE